MRNSQWTLVSSRIGWLGIELVSGRRIRAQELASYVPFHITYVPRPLWIKNDEFHKIYYEHNELHNENAWHMRQKMSYMIMEFQWSSKENVKLGPFFSENKKFPRCTNYILKGYLNGIEQYIACREKTLGTWKKSLYIHTYIKINLKVIEVRYQNTPRIKQLYC